MVFVRNNSERNVNYIKIRKFLIKLIMYVNRDKLYFMIYIEIIEINYRCIKIFICLMYI